MSVSILPIRARDRQVVISLLRSCVGATHGHPGILRSSGLEATPATGDDLGRGTSASVRFLLHRLHTVEMRVETEELRVAV